MGTERIRGGESNTGQLQQQLNTGVGTDAIRYSVDIHSYTPEWSVIFQQARQQMLSSREINEGALDILHVGSTAIPNLDAKPIIDILIGVPSIEVADTLIPHIQRFGYEHVPVNSQQRNFGERRFLRKYVSPDENYNVHITTKDSPWRKDAILFRDYLLTHPDVARKYMELKYQLAAQYPNDRPAYVTAKSDFIASVLASI